MIFACSLPIEWPANIYAFKIDPTYRTKSQLKRSRWRIQQSILDMVETTLQKRTSLFPQHSDSGAKMRKIFSTFTFSSSVYYYLQDIIHNKYFIFHLQTIFSFLLHLEQYAKFYESKMMENFFCCIRACSWVFDFIHKYLIKCRCINCVRLYENELFLLIKSITRHHIYCISVVDVENSYLSFCMIYH